MRWFIQPIWGGTTQDFAAALAVDSDRNAYVTGWTSSGDFPVTPGAFDVTNEVADAFVTKLNAAGSALVYSTFLGSSLQGDAGSGIAVDAAGRAHVTGLTLASDFPTQDPLFGSVCGGSIFVTKFTPDGSALAYSTCFNERASGRGTAIAVDASGNIYVTGATASQEFPVTSGAFQKASGGGTDAVLAKLSPDGALLYSTYLGGRGVDEGLGVGVDSSGHAYVAGGTTSDDFPIADAVQANLGGGSSDGFIAKLAPESSGAASLVYSTYLGGSAGDTVSAIAVDGAGNAYLTGPTQSADFPLQSPLQDALAGGDIDAFVAKLSQAVIGVDVDIMPRQSSNRINLRANGTIPVAILTTPTFDAALVSPVTVRFGPGAASLERPGARLRDVDGDKDLDLLLRFRIQQTGIQCGETRAALIGETFDGQSIQGSDRIATFGCR